MTVQHYLQDLRALHARAVLARETLFTVRAHAEARISGDVEHARDDVFDVGLECSGAWVGDLIEAVARVLSLDVDSPQARIPTMPGELCELARLLQVLHARTRVYAAAIADACAGGAKGERLAALRDLYAVAGAEVRAAEAVFMSALAAAVSSGSTS